MPSIPLPIHPQRRRGLHGLLTAENWPCSRQGRTHGSLATLRHQGPGAEGRQLGGGQGYLTFQKAGHPVQPRVIPAFGAYRQGSHPRRRRVNAQQRSTPPRVLATWVNCHTLSRRRRRRPRSEGKTRADGAPTRRLPQRDRRSAECQKPNGRCLNFAPAALCRRRRVAIPTAMGGWLGGRGSGKDPPGQLKTTPNTEGHGCNRRHRCAT